MNLINLAKLTVQHYIVQHYIEPLIYNASMDFSSNGTEISDLKSRQKSL